MALDYLQNAGLGVLPVIAFLATLVHFDSFRLVKAQTVVYVIAAGSVVAIAAYFVNSALLVNWPYSFAHYTHFVAPVIEESLKALIIMALMQTNRIGFVFDAVILGFAVGTGFALVENFYYLQVLGVDQPAVWMIRGFGTAIMHGGVTAIFAIVAHLLTLNVSKVNPLLYVPGFIAAITLHSGFNYFLSYPVSSTIVTMSALAATLAIILKRDKKSIHDWIAIDFDYHRTLLIQIRSGEYPEGRFQIFLDALHDRFDAEGVEKTIYYIELHTELVLVAEEVLIAHEVGEIMLITEEVKEKLLHLHIAEKGMGKTVHLMLTAHLKFTRHEFWELYMLEKEAGFKHPHTHGV